MTQQTRKPYALVGAEQLTASIHKTGDELIGFQYRFNIIRLVSQTGRVTHWFGPNDLEALVKLTRVLAGELAIDGCMDSSLRQRLCRLSVVLDEAIEGMEDANSDGAYQ